MQTQVMVENITGFGMDVPMLGIRDEPKQGDFTFCRMVWN